LAFVVWKLYRKLDKKDDVKPAAGPVKYKDYPSGNDHAHQEPEILVEAPPGLNEEPRELDGREQQHPFEPGGNSDEEQGWR
jgi:hypothetical protein